ncbi:RND family efflux transporter, MFP subunit [Lishizhenia tianjinensis]|uniref:RND family efflux transporter, MFP subunit n=1 Tax=Lishizhenia tianjinensis TaxID=477690 RepID=A0A1I6ZSC6_9FLAO|nr:efflux RND transporter periplasmic adaptor subunit [Lishizhenia tianjinensis]SFT65618.1 RND family efflux transporter, MFP subunit [Lishizhenia tianjinensis]
MKKFNFLVVAVLGVAVAACNSPMGSLDKLKKEKAELKDKIKELDDKIAALDTVKEYVYPLVEFGAARTDKYVHKISVQGAVETDKDALINAETGGVIQRILVKEGQRVSKGQTLVTLDAEILSSSINEVKTSLSFAEYMLDKQKQLMERGVGSEFELKQAENQVNSLRSKLETLSAQRKQASVTAPFSGVVDRIFPKEGEIAGPQSPLVRLVNNSEVRITADISESHLTAVNIGTPIEVYVPTLKDTFNMEVTAKANYIEPTNRTFRIQSSLKGNKQLLPNMVAELHITDMILDSVMVVPTQSILKTQQNESFLYVANHEGSETYNVRRVYLEVISAFQGESAIRILSGELKDGDVVVAKGARGITEKDLVKEKK